MIDLDQIECSDGKSYSKVSCNQKQDDVTQILNAVLILELYYFTFFFDYTFFFLFTTLTTKRVKRKSLLFSELFAFLLFY